MEQHVLNHYLSKYPFRELTDDSGKTLNQLVTCPVRVAFAYLDKPKTKQNGKVVFSASLIVPPSADVSVAKKLAGNALSSRFGGDWVTRVKASSLGWPLKPQSKLHAKGYDGFSSDGVYIEAETMYDVPVVGRSMEPLTRSDRKQVYSGMWVLARLRVYTYPNAGAKGPSKEGASFGLISLQKIADDVEFKGSDATGEFDEIEPVPGAAPVGAAKTPASMAFDL